MTNATNHLSNYAHPAFPMTLYYAFKQSESEVDAGTASTGWETFLDAVIRAGFGISGTWPMRTEQSAALKASLNALTTSIILVCRKRIADALTGTRRDFLNQL
jgi:putative DNA methylase